LQIAVPKIFCFKKDPHGASDFFIDLKNGLSRKKPFNLNISHENTEEIGLSASYLFDKLVKDYRAKWRRLGVEIGLSGRISIRSKQVNNFLLSFGLLKELNISAIHFTTGQVDFDYKDKYLTFKCQGSKKQNFKKSEASTGLVNYFNGCFNYNGLQITEEGRSTLVDTFGEIIGNAEEHCGNEDGNWFALGCYDKDTHVCGFAIINFGKTIYENLSDETSTASEVIGKIRDVIESNKPFFDKIKQVVNTDHDEPIWNVMALQDGISSKRTTSGKGRTRGQGFMDVLSFIDNVKAEDNGATLCLVSGKSAIIVDYQYPILNKKIANKDESRRILAFNKTGDLHRPPDLQKVIFLKNHIEGTVFSGSFRIDEKYLKSRLENKNDKRR
jgi:hypothetical protein